MAGNVMELLRILSKNRYVRYLLPFLAFLGIGSVGLGEFSKTRYAFTHNQNWQSVEEYNTFTQKKEFARKRKSLQEQIDEMLHTDTSHWVNIRGPRPGEDSKTMQAEQRRKLQEKQE
ncbi:hypothetical protein CHS0354_001495 [Potamilus streckersoni]|uniref:Cytochrome c oxidase assembly protein COX16 homolog, mitochondrial n=1 Tax=Potamilus streckersoni TaxID=2493646 RepID=A0AAE0VJP5_9BIVA|nr:hypothetical protein CHS0354_001495 [Potamilus streckersoni]